MKPVPGLEACFDEVVSADKLRLIPALGDIVAKGRVVEERHCAPGEDLEARSYTTMETVVDLDGKSLTVRFIVLATHDGRHIYCPMLDQPGPDGDGVNLWFVEE
jgi:hypothetical protein